MLQHGMDNQEEMKTETYYGYHIAGNRYHAIAISVDDPTEVHWFDIDPDVNNDAYVRAKGWAYPGIGTPQMPDIKPNQS